MWVLFFYISSPKFTSLINQTLSFSSSSSSSTSDHFLQPLQLIPMLLPDTPKHNKLTQIKEFFTFSNPSKPLHSSFTFPKSPKPASNVSESAMEEFILNAAPIITKWDSESSDFNRITFLFRHSHHEAQAFLTAVNNLRQSMHFLITENSTSGKLVLAQKLMQIAMKRLEKEFYQILSENRDHLGPESVSSKSTSSENELEGSNDSLTEIERVSMTAMADLKSIADSMIESGYGKECVKIYKVIRKSIVDETLYRLGSERFKSSRVQRMNWGSLEHVIKNWMNAIKVAVNSLFRGEKILCDHVFSRSDTIRESCFSEITKEAALILFKFPELVAKTKKDSEKIFVFMEIHELGSDIFPESEMMFDSESTSAIRLQAQTSLTKISDSIRSILSDFESNIQKDSSKTPVSGGGIHPLTQSTMNFISSLSNYGAILSEIIPISDPKPEQISDEDLTSPVAAQFAWIILVLLCKLDSKAEVYKNAALSYLFLANNLQFIVKKVNATNLKSILGQEWISNHENKVKLYASSYESMAWKKVISSLPERNLEEEAVSALMVKESFKKFNAAFEEAYRKQTSWIVSDGKLRDELKVSIGNKVITRYREFYNESCEMWSGEDDDDDLKQFVRFSPDDLGNYLTDLFQGISSSGSSSSYSSSSSSSSSSHGCVPILSR